MKSFLYKSIIALILFLSILLFGFLFIPGKKDTAIYAVLDKNKLLEKTPSSRIIFIGGSNLSFGLDSKQISKKFGMPVVNTGVHGGIGLRFMLKDIIQYVQKNDILVLVPEYQQYFGSTYYGDIALVSLLDDAYPEGFKYLSRKQWYLLIPNMVKYAGIKIVRFPVGIWNDLFYKDGIKPDRYNRYSFNQYGDTEINWDKDTCLIFSPQHLGADEKINPEVMKDINEFKNNIEKKGGQLLLLPPLYQESSYNNLKPMIDEINNNETIREINPDFCPSIYMLPDSLFYETPYHANKKGVKLRTDKVISELLKFLEESAIKKGN